MLRAFIVMNRDEIIARTLARVASRLSPMPSEVELTQGIPVFLDQLCDALDRAESTDLIDHDALAKSAGEHGRALLQMGLTVAQVVHDYGDVCQVITRMALEGGAQIPAEQSRTLNMCVDDAIAEAVSEHARIREREIVDRGTEKLGALAHEMRNLLSSAILSFESIQSGLVSPDGRTSVICARSLLGLSNLIDRSLAEVRLDAGLNHLESIPVMEFLHEVESAGSIHARGQGHKFAVRRVDRSITIEGDRQILAAAIANLLQNAFKFTPKGGRVSLNTHVRDGRVLFEVSDACGGLPPGRIEELFNPFEQRGKDRSGIGLGLAICRKAAEANNGELLARDVPGTGCIFTLAIPLQAQSLVTASV